MAQVGTDISHASKLLASGELVSIPTETVYGLAANALDGQAVANIFHVKKRPAFDPLIVHLASKGQVSKYTRNIPEEAKILMENLWPGPLSLVLQKGANIPDIVTSGLDTVAVRVPKHPTTQQLLNEIDFPLAAPSANLFGHVSPTSSQHVNDQLGLEIKYILEGGDCDVGLESTIIGWEDKQATIYRFGGYSKETVEALIGPVAINTSVSSHPTAPGMLSSHYAPKTRLAISDFKEIPEGSVLLRFSTYLSRYPKDLQYILSESGNLNEAARNLFAFMRRLDALDAVQILAEEAPVDGLGRAINDRLRRAAVKL